MKRRTALGIGIATAGLMCAAGLAWLMLAPRHAPPGQPPLFTLDSGSLPAFREAFNACSGDLRLLVLLSPT